MTRSDTPDLIASALRRPRGSPGGARPGAWPGTLAPWASEPPTPSCRKRCPGSAAAAMSESAAGRQLAPAPARPQPKPPLPRRPPWITPGPLCASSPELLMPRFASCQPGPPAPWPPPPMVPGPLAEWRRSRAPAQYLTPLRRAVEERAREAVSRSTGSLATKSQLYDIHPSKYQTRHERPYHHVPIPLIPREAGSDRRRGDWRREPSTATTPSPTWTPRRGLLDATLSVHEPGRRAPAATFTFRSTGTPLHPSDRRLATSASSLSGALSHVRQRIDLHPLDSTRYRSSPARQEQPVNWAHSRSEPHIPASAGYVPSRHLLPTPAYLEGRRTSDTALVPTPTPPAPPTRGSSFWTFSRSLDNLYACLAERRRGDGTRSREGRPTPTPTPPPRSAPPRSDRIPVVQLSRSPRRYAALSLSESAIFSKASGPSWRLAPSITITDNELSPVGGGGGSRSMEELRGGDGAGVGGGATDYLGFGSLALHKTVSPASPVASQELDEILTDIAVHSSPRLSDESSAQSDRFAQQLHSLIDSDDGGGASGRENEAGEEEDAEEYREERPADGTGRACPASPASRLRHRRLSEAVAPAPAPTSLCRRVLRLCRTDAESRRVLSRAARVGYLSRGRGCLFLGFPGPASASAFLRHGLDGLLVSPAYLSLREIQAHARRLGDYVHELQTAGSEYDPDSRFVLSVSVSAPAGPLTARRLAKIRLAPATTPPALPPPSSPSSAAAASASDTLILTPPAGAGDGERPGAEGRRSRELALTSIQRELRERGVCLRRDHPRHYAALCRYVETGSRPPPAAIYPLDRRTGRRFLCLLLPASEPLALGWVDSPRLLRDLL
ncbi:apical junction component 1 homolog [Lethenteron reissneri]|uniref:apical junction component 1 homolog n=1 Tax=Lethenteron reissneri TaxID=7753 RepID=UPI002AB619ED|nr:apical junction component 1 homolog [Lethenteron reissneri]